MSADSLARQVTYARLDSICILPAHNKEIVSPWSLGMITLLPAHNNNKKRVPEMLFASRSDRFVRGCMAVLYVLLRISLGRVLHPGLHA
jgi:hypothetical protein